MNIFKTKSEIRNKGTWNYTELRIAYENGASILLRGYECPFCKNFINHKSGIKKFCDECGADMRASDAVALEETYKRALKEGHKHAQKG